MKAPLMRIEIQREEREGGWVKIITEVYEVKREKENEEILQFKKVKEIEFEYHLPGC